MQINGSPVSSALVPYPSTASSQANSVDKLSATAATARDKQSGNADRESAQQQSALQQTASHTNTIAANTQRINRIEQSHNDPLSSSTHMAQRAVRTFQQIDQLAQPELMNRVDALA